MIGDGSRTQPPLGNQGNDLPRLGGHNPHNTHIVANAGNASQDARGAWHDMQQQQGKNVQARHPPLLRVPRRDQLIALLQEQLGLEFRPIGRPMYTKLHSDEVNQAQFPKDFRVLEFHTFSGENPIYDGTCC